jgi:hypothetical protein
VTLTGRGRPSPTTRRPPASPDLRAHGAELLHERLEVLGVAPAHRHVAAGERPRDEEGPRLDPVRNDGVVEGSERGDALDPELVGARALDPRAHLDEGAREVGHLRLAGAVPEHGAPLGERRGHHHVLGAGDGLAVEGEDRPVEPAAGANAST